MLRILQIGAIGVVVAASTLRPFDLDRFFVPKELVFHLAAALAGLFALRGVRRAAASRVDLLLAVYIALGAASAALAANSWLAIRAVAISASSLLVFRAARAVAAAGLARPLVNALSLAVVLAAAGSLLQTYGVETLLFSENRAPGGTLGNRNFVAHIAAFGLPLLLVSAMAARRAASFLAGGAGVAATVATLALTRSRAAWLSFAVVVAIFLLMMLFSAVLRRDGRSWRRLALIVLLAGAGVAAALLIPNTLRWRGENPYIDTVMRIADYEE